MTRNANTANTASPRTASSGKASTIWLQGLGCGAIVTLATPTALLLVALLAPAGLAFVLDPRPCRPVFRPIFLWGLAMAAAPLATLWRGGHTLEGSLALVTDFSVLATAWSAQAGSWLAAEFIPVLVRVALDGRDMARIAMLRTSRAGYEAEWDIPPALAEDVP